MSFSSYGQDGDEPNYTYNITGVAISNKTIVLVSSIGFASLGLVLFIILRRLSTNNDHDEQQENNVRARDAYGEILDQSDVATLNRAQRRARAKFRMKKARRIQTPGQHQAEGIGGDDAGALAQGNGEGDNVMRHNGGRNNDLSNLTRKERQKAAKAMEREERKISAEEARLWREKKHPTMKSEGNNRDDKEKMLEYSIEDNELSVEEIYPRSSDENDPLSESLFWESIVKNIKEKTNSSGEIISIVEQLPKMTIREFIERLKQNGSVPIASLADEFRIAVPQALAELEKINNQHGIVGISDANSGSFIYVSMEMIKEAIQYGEDAGRVSCPDRIKTIKGCK
ncbi:hypothetical protein ACHAXR_003891 [Thalassiosira sp. AJA248-18]